MVVEPPEIGVLRAAAGTLQEAAATGELPHLVLTPGKVVHGREPWRNEIGGSMPPRRSTWQIGTDVAGERWSGVNA
jgi:hypothetical protein